RGCPRAPLPGSRGGRAAYGGVAGLRRAGRPHHGRKRLRRAPGAPAAGRRRPRRPRRVPGADLQSLRDARRRTGRGLRHGGLAGLRVGLAFGAPPLLTGLRTVKDSYNLNRLSQAAATAALADQTTVRENVARVTRTRARLVEALRALGYDVPESHANFVLART